MYILNIKSHKLTMNLFKKSFDVFRMLLKSLLKKTKSLYHSYVLTILKKLAKF